MPTPKKTTAKKTNRNYTMSGEGKYDKSPKRMKANAARKRARHKMEKLGLVKKHDGKDVDHKNGNPNDNRRTNLRVQKASKNRSIKRNSKAGKR